MVILTKQPILTVHRLKAKESKMLPFNDALMVANDNTSFMTRPMLLVALLVKIDSIEDYMSKNGLPVNNQIKDAVISILMKLDEIKKDYAEKFPGKDPLNYTEDTMQILFNEIVKDTHGMLTSLAKMYEISTDKHDAIFGSRAGSFLVESAFMLNGLCRILEKDGLYVTSKDITSMEQMDNHFGTCGINYLLSVYEHLGMKMPKNFDSYKTYIDKKFEDHKEICDCPACIAERAEREATKVLH